MHTLIQTGVAEQEYVGELNTGHGHVCILFPWLKAMDLAKEWHYLTVKDVRV